MKASTVGSTSAVALSHDHTYLASGHVSGYIQIFDLKNPQVPARIVAPPSAQAIMSGRQEGHPTGSRIVNVSFVAGRHTAIISADENGLAFYHSLGKVLFVDASDTIRILGNYPQEPSHEATSSIPALNTSGTRSFRRRKPRNTLLAMATLPLGTVAHQTDAYQIVALLTTNKLVIVGLKPSPKTWLKRARPDDVELASLGRRRGTLAWFPCINTPHGPKDVGSDKTHPTLAYSWGRSVRLLLVSETMMKQSVLNSRTGKTREVDMGTLVFEDAGNWIVDDVVVALQWLNANVRVSVVQGNEWIWSDHHHSNSSSSQQLHSVYMTLIPPSLSNMYPSMLRRWYHHLLALRPMGRRHISNPSAMSLIVFGLTKGRYSFWLVASVMSHV